MQKWYAVIDLKAFYASVECVDRGLDPFVTPLIVMDESRGAGALILSVTPFLKQQGIPSRLRRYELPPLPHLIIAPPRMERYLEASTAVINIFLDFIGEDDLYVYSIDEAFLYLSPYLRLYHTTPEGLTKKILHAIQEQLRLPAAAGIGPNMFLAKMALDLEGKHSPQRYALWREKDVPYKLHPRPASDLWGVSSGRLRKLQNLGLFTIGDIAHFPVEVLKKHFGVIGEEIYQHAWGQDAAFIRERYEPLDQHLSLSQILPRDYTRQEARQIVKEMSDDLLFRLRQQKRQTACVSLMIMNASGNYEQHQDTLNFSTASSSIIKQTLLKLYDRYAPEYGIRRIGLAFAKLTKKQATQLELWSDMEEQLERDRLDHTLDQIRLRYGMNAVLPLSSLEPSSTIIERHNLIGGHKK